MSLNVIENCIKFKSFCIFSDTVLNNSLRNALKSISHKVCFASPVARVSSSKIEHYEDMKELSALKGNLSTRNLSHVF